MVQEHRPFPRKKRRFQVTFTDDHGVTRIGFTHDVSQTGFFVVAGDLPPIGQDLNLELQTSAGQNVKVQGRVVRRRRSPLALAATFPPGFGVGVTGYFEDYTRLVAAL